MTIRHNPAIPHHQQLSKVDPQAANPRARRNTNGGNNEGPARDLSAFLLATSKDHGLTTSQGDHHAIFSPERAAPQGQIC
jgi:hypothetical protein